MRKSQEVNYVGHFVQCHEYNNRRGGKDNNEGDENYEVSSNSEGDENYEVSSNSEGDENYEGKYDFFVKGKGQIPNDKESNFCYDHVKKNCSYDENDEDYDISDSMENTAIKNKKNNFLSNIICELNMSLKNDIVCAKDLGENIKMVKNNLPKIKVGKKYVEVGRLGIWKLSSSKYKSDMKNLKDNNANTYWQSSSLGPHTITIQFIKLTKISKICLLFNYSLDESYTPYEITINVGSDENHLEFLCSTFCDVNKYPFNDPFWFIIDLKKFHFFSYLYNFNQKVLKKTDFIYCHCLQICILSSQHYGKDTRIRQIKVFSPNYTFYKYDKMLT
ncbi:anaphase promoting complex subunit 10, putative [Plasmodium malariae]|uniref:Anaphase promoting complex subunit 10, putative n=1 Tax=Plasmodium malariae TaxID=5858 RepID=A0A1A8XCI6_PLAMA|nr:anaphase promoting complex subunit 10, putative [Plasmodium malariae]